MIGYYIKGFNLKKDPTFFIVEKQREQSMFFLKKKKKTLNIPMLVLVP